MPPLRRTRFETESATDARSGKSDRKRMTRTVGQMKIQRAASSERHAPSEETARRVARALRSDLVGAGPRGSRSMGLSLDAKAGDVGRQLVGLPCSLGDLVPAVGDGLLGGGL